jgi:hypothetical protein
MGKTGKSNLYTEKGAKPGFSTAKAKSNVKFLRKTPFKVKNF